jgi:hypothetical protein
MIFSRRHIKFIWNYVQHFAHKTANKKYERTNKHEEKSWDFFWAESCLLAVFVVAEAIEKILIRKPQLATSKDEEAKIKRRS